MQRSRASVCIPRAGNILVATIFLLAISFATSPVFVAASSFGSTFSETPEDSVGVVESTAPVATEVSPLNEGIDAGEDDEYPQAVPSVSSKSLRSRSKTAALNASSKFTTRDVAIVALILFSVGGLRLFLKSSYRRSFANLVGELGGQSEAALGDSIPTEEQLSINHMKFVSLAEQLGGKASDEEKKRVYDPIGNVFTKMATLRKDFADQSGELTLVKDNLNTLKAAIGASGEDMEGSVKKATEAVNAKVQLDAANEMLSTVQNQLAEAQKELAAIKEAHRAELDAAKSEVATAKAEVTKVKSDALDDAAAMAIAMSQMLEAKLYQRTLFLEGGRIQLEHSGLSKEAKAQELKRSAEVEKAVNFVDHFLDEGTSLLTGRLLHRQMEVPQPPPKLEENYTLWTATFGEAIPFPGQIPPQLTTGSAPAPSTSIPPASQLARTAPAPRPQMDMAPPVEQGGN